MTNNSTKYCAQHQKQSVFCVTSVQHSHQEELYVYSANSRRFERTGRTPSAIKDCGRLLIKPPARRNVRALSPSVDHMPELVIRRTQNNNNHDTRERSTENQLYHMYKNVSCTCISCCKLMLPYDRISVLFDSAKCTCVYM